MVSQHIPETSYIADIQNDVLCAIAITTSTLKVLCKTTTSDAALQLPRQMSSVKKQVQLAHQQQPCLAHLDLHVPPLCGLQLVRRSSDQNQKWLHHLQRIQCGSPLAGVDPPEFSQELTCKQDWHRKMLAKFQYKQQLSSRSKITQIPE